MKRDLEAALTGPAAKELKAKILEAFRVQKERLDKAGAESAEGVVFINGHPRSINEDD